MGKCHSKQQDNFEYKLKQPLCLFVSDPGDYSHILMYTCLNIGFKNTPKQGLASSRKTLLKKDFVQFDIKFDPKLARYLKIPLFLENHCF